MLIHNIVHGKEMYVPGDSQSGIHKNNTFTEVSDTYNDSLIHKLKHNR